MIDRATTHFGGKTLLANFPFVLIFFFAEGPFNQNLMLISLSVERALLKISVCSNQLKILVFVLTYLQWLRKLWC